MDSYYYLNENKEPQGPHTLDELRALLETGRLQPETRAARRGAAHWGTLAELLAAPAEPAAAALPPAPPAPQAGTCPGCACELTAPGGILPARCPSCGYRFRAVNIHDLWQNFVLALRKTFVLRGRAPRIEYWSFILFSTIITTILMTIMQVVMVALLPAEAVTALESPETAEQLDSLPSAAIVAMAVMGIVYTLVNLAVTIPQLTVMVRRMHDVGRSGKRLLLYMLMVFVCVAGAFTLAANHDNETAGAILIIGVLIPAICLLALGIFFFVLTVLDSHRGPNKYGPSPKYPLA